MSAARMHRLRRLAPWISGAAFLVAAILIARSVREAGLSAMLEALTALEASLVAAAIACTLCSYFTLTLFDYLAIRTALKKRLPYARVAMSSFAAQSLGHVVGLAGLSSGMVRYRLYGHHGLTGSEVARIVLFSGATIALGLATLAGGAGVTRPHAVADLFDLPGPAALAIGATLLAAVLLYVVWCARVREPVRVAGFRLPVPTARVAWLQIAAGTINYLLVAATLYFLLGDHPNVSLVSFVALYSAGHALGIAVHVPGGFGVLEMVVLAAVPGAAALSALLAFRVVYYFVPFLIGGALYAIFESSHARAAARGEPNGP